jgi:hypothetical protein
LFPKSVGLLSLPENIFQVQFMVDILADYANPEGIIHGFIEEITKELNHIGVMLSFKKLNCFFLNNFYG